LYVNIYGIKIIAKPKQQNGAMRQDTQKSKQNTE
jgi:hypothetical protein